MKMTHLNALTTSDEMNKPKKKDEESLIMQKIKLLSIDQEQKTVYSLITFK